MATDGIVFQRVTRLEGVATNEVVVMSEPGWYDAQGITRLVLRAVVYSQSESTLKIQTSPVRDSGDDSAATSPSKWRDAVADVATGTYVLDSAPGATNPLDRFVRWVVVSDGTVSTPPWSVCFWIGIAPKT